MSYCPQCAKLIRESEQLREEKTELAKELARVHVLLMDARDAELFERKVALHLAGQVNKAEAERDKLREELARAEHWCGDFTEACRQRDAAVANHSELLYAVARKYPGETRHETALRYIREREQEPHGDAAREGSADKGSGDEQR